MNKKKTTHKKKSSKKRSTKKIKDGTDATKPEASPEKSKKAARDYVNGLIEKRHGPFWMDDFF